MSKPKSLVRNVTLGMWMLSTLSWALCGALSFYLLLDAAERFAKERIASEEANLISLGLVDVIARSEYDRLGRNIADTLPLERLNEIIRVYDPPASLVYNNIHVPEIDRIDIDRSQYLNRGFYILNGATNQYFAILKSFQAQDGRVLWVEIAAVRPPLLDILRTHLRPFLLLFSILLIAWYFIAKTAATQILNPLGRLGALIDRIKTSNPIRSELIPANELPEDFEAVVRKMNELVLRAQKSLLKSHRMSRYMAHELRTPLTIIRGEIETHLDEVENEASETVRLLLKSVLEEVARMDEIVSTVLKISAREQGSEIYRASWMTLASIKEDIDRLVGEVSKKISLEFQLDPGATLESTEILIDKELFLLLLSNLLRNFGRHTPSEAEAKLLFMAKSEEKRLSVRLVDTGGGMSQELLREANAESEEAPKHLGLGIQLCKEICRLNSLKLDFRNNDLGGLTTEIFTNQVRATAGSVSAFPSNAATRSAG